MTVLGFKLWAIDPYQLSYNHLYKFRIGYLFIHKRVLNPSGYVWRCSTFCLYILVFSFENTEIILMQNFSSETSFTNYISWTKKTKKEPRWYRSGLLWAQIWITYIKLNNTLCVQYRYMQNDNNKYRSWVYSVIGV